MQSYNPSELCFTFLRVVPGSPAHCENSSDRKDDYGSLESDVKAISKFHKEKVRNTFKKTLIH